MNYKKAEATVRNTDTGGVYASRKVTFGQTVLALAYEVITGKTQNLRT